MKEDKLIEVVEYYEGIIMTRKTVNGIDVEVENNPVGNFIMQKKRISFEEAKHIYGERVLPTPL